MYLDVVLQLDDHAGRAILCSLVLFKAFLRSLSVVKGTLLRALALLVVVFTLALGVLESTLPSNNSFANHLNN